MRLPDFTTRARVYGVPMNQSPIARIGAKVDTETVRYVGRILLRPQPGVAVPGNRQFQRVTDVHVAVRQVVDNPRGSPACRNAMEIPRNVHPTAFAGGVNVEEKGGVGVRRIDLQAMPVPLGFDDASPPDDDLVVVGDVRSLVDCLETKALRHPVIIPPHAVGPQREVSPPIPRCPPNGSAPI